MNERDFNRISDLLMRKLRHWLMTSVSGLGMG